jgi:hypothetical protein
LCELLSFLDAYSGYHKISLTIGDKEKIAFNAPFRLFCYIKVTFGLKNAGGGGTFQKGTQIILETQIRQNVEAYIDFVVVKSEKHGDLLDNFKETFDNLRKYMMMLNPRKCVWCINRKTARLHGIDLGNQCKSEEGGGH